MTTELQKKSEKNDFEKDLFKLMNSTVFSKTLENVRKYCNIKLAKKGERRNYYELEPNYHTRKWFSEKFLEIKMKKKK